jgi:hypothetical protein
VLPFKVNRGWPLILNIQKYISKVMDSDENVYLRNVIMYIQHEWQAEQYLNCYLSVSTPCLWILFLLFIPNCYLSVSTTCLWILSLLFIPNCYLSVSIPPVFEYCLYCSSLIVFSLSLPPVWILSLLFIPNFYLSVSSPLVFGYNLYCSYLIVISLFI